MAKDEQYADLSHRILAVTAADKGLFQASFSTVYRVLRKEGLMTARGAWRGHNGHSKPPVRKELTGPNQRWCWDISYLMNPPEGAVPLPLPAAGRVVPEDHPVAHRLDTDRQGIPMATRGWFD